MPVPSGQQDPEVIRQWMSQNLMNVSTTPSSAGQPYPQIDPRLLGGAAGPGNPPAGYGSSGQGPHYRPGSGPSRR